MSSSDDEDGEEDASTLAKTPSEDPVQKKNADSVAVKKSTKPSTVKPKTAAAAKKSAGNAASGAAKKASDLLSSDEEDDDDDAAAKKNGSRAGDQPTAPRKFQLWAEVLLFRLRKVILWQYYCYRKAIETEMHYPKKIAMAQKGTSW